MRPIRLAGYNERRCIARDSLSLYGYIVTLATYQKSSSVTAGFQKDVIYKALKECIVQHPILGAAIQDSTTEKPWLGRPASISLEDHIVMVGTYMEEHNDLGVILEQAHNAPVISQDERPQWRVYIAQQGHSTFHLAFACSHALADGRSGLFFHRTFLEALERVNQSQLDASPNFSLPRTREPLPPLELVGNLAISWPFLLGPLLNEYVPAWLMRAIGMQSKTVGSHDSAVIWTGSSSRPVKSPTELPTTAVRTREISNEVVQTVLSVCKTHHARLTGLLLHLAARSLARALKQQGADHKRFKVDTALDLRRCIPEGENQIGVLVSSVDTLVNVDPAKTENQLSSEDWTAVHETTTRLEKASSTLSDQPVGLLKYLSNYRDWTSRKAQSPANSSFEISNLGRFDSPVADSSAWSVKRMSFSQSADATGAPFSINVASVGNGPLVIVLSWWPGMLAVSDEERLVDDVCDGIISQLQSLGN